MRVTVNGNSLEIDEALTVVDLLRTANVPPNYLAVEINDEVIPRALHAERRMADGDRVEVVTLVGGG